MKILHRKKKNIIRKRDYKPLIIFFIIFFIPNFIQHTSLCNIYPIDIEMDENVYVLKEAYQAGQDTAILTVPETVTNVEEAAKYQQQIRQQAMVYENTVDYTALCANGTFSFNKEEGIIVSKDLKQIDMERLYELYDQETEKVKALVADTFDTLSQREQFTLIVKYIKNNYRYGVKGDNIHYDMEEAITESKKMSCTQYSQLLYGICQRMDIDCIVLLSDTHAWNAVRFGDNDYYTLVDLCAPVGYIDIVEYCFAYFYDDYYKINYNAEILRPAGIEEFFSQIVTNIKY